MNTAKRNQIVVAHLGLIGRALTCLGRAGDEDLYQEGALGLIRAVERFDRRRGVKFSTYATRAIFHRLIDAMATDCLVRVPRTIGRRGGLRACPLTPELLQVESGSDE